MLIINTRDYSFQFWLRIGVSYEDPDGIRSDDLQVLDIITNTEGRLITPSNKDWVDINDIIIIIILIIYYVLIIIILIIILILLLLILLLLIIIIIIIIIVIMMIL